MNRNRSHRPPTGRAPSFLAIYLNDHLTGANGGVEVLRRAADAHRGGALGTSLESLAEQVAQDRLSLRTLMADLDVPVMRTRAALGRLAEKVGRLKLNGRILARSPLSDVLELEAMRMGVEGKAACWRSLRSLARTDPRIDTALIEELLQRAEQQIRALEAMRSACASQLFAREARGRAATPRAAEAVRRRGLRGLPRPGPT
ncbi:hypothetical protein NRK68_02845 [Streptomyces yangpuensis]|uniref:DUF222 domain-containing protein n=1 Tax=Streptomyces yangpuensis TaxID=1648182 RepID=A0ABY5PRP1_9ACTN|nr:hypothetical protein [Streptomyces yangpuensis]UUY46248.1 hypothetical protein NRK68_02845 [Streptomyces yangpuensis]